MTQCEIFIMTMHVVKLCMYSGASKCKLKVHDQYKLQFTNIVKFSYTVQSAIHASCALNI